MNFRNLHYQDTPLLIGNVWDVPSVKIVERLNYQAIGTSSAAIASLLGYEDGEKMTFDELEYFVKRIALNTKLPLSVDLEAGYGRDPIMIANHIKRLVDLGVVGINIEDSIVKANRELLKPDEFYRTLSAITDVLDKDAVEIFLNIRIDTFLLGLTDPTKETIKRIRLYENAGADCIFTPYIEDISAIKEIVNSTSLPLNIMCTPNLPDFDILTDLGVKRISMGNYLFDKMYTQLYDTTKVVSCQKSIKSLFSC